MLHLNVFKPTIKINLMASMFSIIKLLKKYIWFLKKKLGYCYIRYDAQLGIINA